jgi:hypothetical protein
VHSSGCHVAVYRKQTVSAQTQANVTLAVPCRAVPCRAVPCRVFPCPGVPCRAVPSPPRGVRRIARKPARIQTWSRRSPACAHCKSSTFESSSNCRNRERRIRSAEAGDAASSVPRRKP